MLFLSYFFNEEIVEINSYQTDTFALLFNMRMDYAHLKQWSVLQIKVAHFSNSSLYTESQTEVIWYIGTAIISTGNLELVS